MGIQEGFIIETVDAQKIAEADFSKLFQIEQDMWARDEGMGEYVWCDNCGTSHSKQDIYGHLSQDIYLETVTNIEQILGLESIKCTGCGSDTEHIYGENHKDKIIDRNVNKKSYLSILRDEKGEITGFMDGYIDTFSEIFNKDFKYHYGNIGEETVKKIIENILQKNMPETLMSFSALGTEEKSMNLFNIYELLTHFFHSISEEDCKITGITELNAGQTLHSLYYGLGIQQVGLSTNEYLANLRENIGPNYNSDLFIQNEVGKYKESFTGNLRQFLRQNKQNIKRILVD